MKKTIIGIIIVCALGAISYTGYEYSNYNKNLSKNTTADVVNPATTQQTTKTSAADSDKTATTSSKTATVTELGSSKAQNTVESKNSTTTDQKQSSDSTIAKFVPSKVIDYASQNANTKTIKATTSTNSKVEAPATTENTPKASKSPVVTQKNDSENTKPKTQVVPPKQNTAAPIQDTSSKSTASTSTKSPQPQPTIATNSPSEAAPIISASDIAIPQNSSFNWGLIKVSTNQPNTRILFSGSVNPSKVGTYPVLIQAINTDGLKSQKTINVIVKKGTASTIPVPVIVGSSIIIGQGGIYTPNMLDVHATVDGKPVPVTYSGTVDNNTPGIYTVTATATNSQGVSTSKEFTVQVIHVR